ncbi:hypothetical protein K503DRAFT_33699 [Rhizopogon vinicolor AM-OR11-026]|uniref:Uncharacterized protein n=1 Tax=Rhizopogon vinicolor AM-OR11-026 TaxID=1314800 RepID=A0A1B7MH53_9AGAM|nr:hypothetical protein K503DRAFT_33699 [Rhizopogon vinicolor AM-OR11-026]
MLSNVTHPLSNATLDHVRPRAHGHGHRRRISQARTSQTSIYETRAIEGELTTLFYLTSSPQSLPSSATKTIGRAPVYVINPETASVDSVSVWDNEKGIMAPRKYCALRDEAQNMVTESKQVWLDTSFSIFAFQSFDPPRHPSWCEGALGTFNAELPAPSALVIWTAWHEGTIVDGAGQMPPPQLIEHEWGGTKERSTNKGRRQTWRSQ